ncbi:DNA cytosine methyltransferase [Streptococcus dysgalactiae subsp. equisimilis]|uniref:DNA cytosine methyltransferase n=1 Tax=Streptococcus dysgalactiae TaxID=1334 RepID=UPI00194E8F11|nr:DNA cytosine methyltransferase [Streptococcus dysgalactiae]MBM6533053.1 DNA cytosine methyltransferase [Streptococcus dysgalactiae subsp. equisimilis]
MLNEFEFRDWLVLNKSYSQKVVKDIVCRLNRVNRYLGLNQNLKIDSYYEIIADISASSSVKSQLRRSIRLYFEFLEFYHSHTKLTNEITNPIKVCSMFSNIGVAEAYLEKIGFDVVVANELEERRAKLYSSIYPRTEMIVGDITNQDVFDMFVEKSKSKNVDVLMATPPCQGMSTAGRQQIDDDRNMLILPVIDAVELINPKYVFIENVPMFLKTSIFVEGENKLIIDFLQEKLSEKYRFSISSIDVSDFGVPQSRERAIILLTRIDLDLIWEIPTPDGKKVTLRDAIGHLPDLDPFIKDLNEEERNKIFPFFFEKRAKALKISKWHEPPHHIFRQVEVMQHTASGETAFDNEVFYPRKADGTAVKGYRNTYKRQSWDRPAYTVTMDNRKISSQNNVHPGRKITTKNGENIYSDARTLTLYEIMLIMTIPENWNIPDNAPEAFVRRIIGEGIPPLFVKKVFDNLSGIRGME